MRDNNGMHIGAENLHEVSACERGSMEKRTRSKKKVTKVTRKKRLNKTCLELWSLCVRGRDRTCRNCNSDHRITAHHIRSVTHAATRFDLENGLTLCWKCHSLQKYHPERFQDMIIEIIGQDFYEAMKKKSLCVVDHTIADLEDIKAVLDAKLFKIQNGVDFDNLPY